MEAETPVGDRRAEDRDVVLSGLVEDAVCVVDAFADGAEKLAWRPPCLFVVEIVQEWSEEVFEYFVAFVPNADVPDAVHALFVEFDVVRVEVGDGE